MKERLQKIIARSGIGSRRKAEEYIRQGRVTVNGRTVRQMGTLADVRRDTISIDGIELTEPENKVYILLHKPQGYVTSLHDPEGRKTIDLLYDDIPERLYPVGRLDYDTEGLLVVTNDGLFSQLLQHPRHGIEKKYLVKVKGIPPEAALKRLRDGIVIDGRKTSRSQIRLVKKSQKSSWCEVVLHEGLNRQLKKMFELIGYPTLRIVRTTIGPLQLGRLPSGTYRFLTRAEIEAVREYGATAAKQASPRQPEHCTARPARSVSRQGTEHRPPARRPASSAPRAKTGSMRTSASPPPKPRTASMRGRTPSSSKTRPKATRRPRNSR